MIAKDWSGAGALPIKPFSVGMGCLPPLEGAVAEGDGGSSSPDWKTPPVRFAATLLGRGAMRGVTA